MHDVTMRGRQLLFDNKSAIERRMTLSATAAAAATTANATDAATAALRCIHGACTGSIASGYCNWKEITERKRERGREGERKRDTISLSKRNWANNDNDNGRFIDRDSCCTNQRTPAPDNDDDDVCRRFAPEAVAKDQRKPSKEKIMLFAFVPKNTFHLLKLELD